jgi:hypothetical protein
MLGEEKVAFFIAPRTSVRVGRGRMEASWEQWWTPEGRRPAFIPAALMGGPPCGEWRHCGPFPEMPFGILSFFFFILILHAILNATSRIWNFQMPWKVFTRVERLYRD